MARGYVTGRWGQVHYRASGENGPAVVLVHESPISSEEYVHALPELGRSVRAVAFDTPGYGLSDPPPGPQEIPDYAAALLEAADALGLGDFAVVGTHTGASIAVQMAAQAPPGRVTHAVLSGALVQADRTGEAVHVDTSLYGGGAALQAWEMNASSLAGRTVRSGDGHTVLRPRGAVWRAFRASDGWLTVACEDASSFVRLCEAVGAPDLAVRYRDDEARASAMETVEARLAELLASRPVEEWLRALLDREVPAGRVQSFAEVLDDPQARANGYVGRTAHPDFGAIDVAGLPILFERDPVAPPPPPRPGADTDAYLAEVGYSAEEIARLRDEGVI